MPVQSINPETFDGAIGRLALVGHDLVRWSWMAIKRDDQWHLFAITVGVFPTTAGDRELASDQIRIATTYLSAENAADNLRRRIVGGPGIEHFETQDTYAAYWLPSGGDFGFGRPSGWPEYYVNWPIAGAEQLRHLAQWQSPFRASGAQFKSLSEAAYVQLFAARFESGARFEVPPGVTIRIPYPYRFSPIRIDADRLHLEVEWSGVSTREDIAVHANWRLVASQAEPNSTTRELAATGGAFTIELDGAPVEVEVFLNDPGIPIPCDVASWTPQEVPVKEKASLISNASATMTHEEASGRPVSSPSADRRGDSSAATERNWDFFVSHASEDKEAVAEPIVAALHKAGVAVWYDKTELKVGDSLRRKIDEGLARCRYGIVILSPEFFAKRWPQAELDGLAARQKAGKKIILPVLHRLTIDELQTHSPMLAGVYCLEWERGLDRVIADLLDVLADDSASVELANGTGDQPMAIGLQESVPGTSDEENDVELQVDSVGVDHDAAAPPEPRSPVDSDPQDLFLKARNWVTEGSLAKLDVQIEDLAATCVQAMRDGEEDLAISLLDRLTATIAATVAYRSANDRAAAARQLPDLYNTILRNQPRLKVDITRVTKELLVRIDALGALGVRRRNWQQVKALAVQLVTGEQRPEVRYVIRHAQLQLARSRRDSRESFLHLANSIIQERRWLRIDAVADDPLILQSLCQFDFLVGLMLLALANDESDTAAIFWPEFARFPSGYSESVLDEVLEDQSARKELGLTSDADLASALRALDRAGRSESFAPYMGWSGYTARAPLDLLRRESLK